jgi:membrane protein implicated in regulation of membrane protease activity
MELLWWHWAVLGLGLILSELVVPAFFMVWFGLGGLLVSLALGAGVMLTLTQQVLLWTLTSILMTVLWFRLFKRGYHKSLIGRASAQLVGETGIIARPVAPFKNGKVRFQKPLVGSDLWDCVADEEIGEGARVRVESVEGNIVTVKKLEG